MSNSYRGLPGPTERREYKNPDVKRREVLTAIGALAGGTALIVGGLISLRPERDTREVLEREFTQKYSREDFHLSYRRRVLNPSGTSITTVRDEYVVEFNYENRRIRVSNKDLYEYIQGKEPTEEIELLIQILWTRETDQEGNITRERHSHIADIHLPVGDLRVRLTPHTIKLVSE